MLGGLAKNVYYAVFGCGKEQIYSLLIFNLFVLLISEGRKFKIFNSVCGIICPFNSINFCFMEFEILLGTCIFMIILFSCFFIYLVLLDYILTL